MKKIVLAGLGLAGLILGMAPQQAKAATSLTVQTMTKNGVNTSRVSGGISSTETYKFRNDGDTFLLFEKTASGTASVFFGVTTTVAGLSVSSLTVTVPATAGDVAVGPFPTRIFNDSSGDVSFTVSETGGLSLAIFKL